MSCHCISQRPSPVSAAAGNKQCSSQGTDLFPMQKGDQKKGELLIHLIPREKYRKTMILYSQNRQSLHLQNSCKNVFTVHRIHSCSVSDTSSHVTDTSRWEMISQWLQAVDTCIQGHGQPLGWDVTCAGVNPCVQILMCKLTVFKGSAESSSCHLFSSDSFTGTWSRLSHCSAHMPNKPLLFFCLKKMPQNLIWESSWVQQWQKCILIPCSMTPWNDRGKKAVARTPFTSCKQTDSYLAANSISG